MAASPRQENDAGLIADGASTAAGGSEASQPDRCPYRRPFPPDFADCPTYQPVSLVGVDSLHRPMPSSVTCGHLTVGRTEARGRFYPRCALGTAAERSAWLCGVGISRAAVMSALREEFDALTQRQREELFTAKAALLASPRAADLEVRLDVLLRDFVEAARRFVADNRERIDGAGLDAAAVVADVDAWTQAWRHTRDLSVGHSAAPGRGFLVPGDASAEPEQELAGEAARPGRKHNREALVVSTASLRILEMPRPPGLRLLGEVDAGSVDALGSALSGVIAGGGDRHLDLSGVLFCDLGGLRVVVDAAQRLGSGRRLVVHGMPAHMRRAMSVAGWDSLPSLVLAEALSA